MATSPAISIQTPEITLGTPYGRSFFVIDGRTAGMELYQRTQAICELQKPQAEIGYPELRLEGIDGVSFASISTGVAEDDNTAIWQISATGSDERYIIHGQIIDDDETWDLISVDHQGRLRHEAVIDDYKTPGRLAAFALKAIKQVPLQSLAERLADEKEITKIQYDTYRTQLQEKDKHRFGDKVATQALGIYVATGFSGQRVNPLKNMIRSDTGAHPKSLAIDQLPSLVTKLLTSTDYKVTVSASAPKHLQTDTKLFK